MDQTKLKLIRLAIIVSINCFIPFASADEKIYIDIPAGKVVMLRYKSKIDGTSQPILIKTPANYSTEKAWPLLVVLHGLGDGPIIAPGIKSMIQIGLYGRGDKWYKGIGEKDVLEGMEIAKNMLSIDEDRIYLTGFSMGGYGTLRLGSRFPHLWAACVPVCPKVPQEFRLQNCNNVPFWIHTGQDDHVLPPAPSEKLFKKSQQAGMKKWLYTEHKGMMHSFKINWEDIEAWLLKQKRVAVPEKIDFQVDDLDANSAYWIEVKQLIDTMKPASVKGEIDGKTVNVSIDNIASLEINLSDQIKGNQLKVSRVAIRNSGKIVCSGKFSKEGIFVYNSKIKDKVEITK